MRPITCREGHIQKKIKVQLLDAKAKSSAKDKRGALFALKRKKMYEGEVNKLNGARMTLESQVTIDTIILHLFRWGGHTLLSCGFLRSRYIW